MPCWMGLLTLRCTITHPPGSPSLPLSLAHGPSQGCAVISLHQDTASPVLCLSSVLGSELFHQRKTEDLGQSCHSQSFSSPHLPHFVCWEAPLCFFSTFFGISAKPSGTNLQHCLVFNTNFIIITILLGRCFFSQRCCVGCCSSSLCPSPAAAGEHQALHFWSLFFWRSSPCPLLRGCPRCLPRPGAPCPVLPGAGPEEAVAGAGTGREGPAQGRATCPEALIAPAAGPAAAAPWRAEKAR